MSESLREQGRRLRRSPMARLMMVGGLILVLLIPLGMVGSLISERAIRRTRAIGEVAATWGESQTIAGPLLTVPYQERVKDTDGKFIRVVREAQFLPETLAIGGELHPERRQRGIFEAVLYRAELHLAGSFRRPSLAEWHINPADILWKDARLSIGVPDLRGLRRVGDLVWQGRPIPLEPGGGEAKLWTSGLRAAIPGLADDGAEVLTFAVDLEVDGSGCLQFVPFGKQTTVALASPWKDPSFIGSFLPDSRSVRAAGFTANWSVPYFGRSYPQAWLAADVERVAPWATVAGSAFGVSLFLPADSYQKTERSQKYAVLFLLLTFLTFFLYEVWSPVVLHSFQYLLVGAALCLFYLLLLSISEHLAFGISYAVAAAATIALITGYSWAILAGRGRALVLGAVLSFLYGYLYVLLQAEDYALLLGSIGLFVILGLVMYLTRRIQWHTRAQNAVEVAL